MLFDTKILAIEDTYLFLGTFIVAFIWIGYITRRRHRQSTIVYAGIPLLAILLATGWAGIKEPLLLLGYVVAALLIAFVGSLDERLRLAASQQLAAQLLLVLVVIATGWLIPYVTNPIGEGVVHLSSSLMGATLLTFAPLWTAVWILLVMNAINWLDGVDGLAAGVGVAAFIVLAAISLLPSTQDIPTLRLSLIGAGVWLGFWLWNIAPAKAYLGTTGSWLLGWYLAIVAMQGGGKIATAALVLAIPLIDAAIVIWQRVKAGRKPWQGDTKFHLHHRLAARGYSPNTIVIIFVTISAALGAVAVAAHTYVKILFLVMVAVILVVATVFIPAVTKTKNPV